MLSFLIKKWACLDSHQLHSAVCSSLQAPDITVHAAPWHVPNLIRSEPPAKPLTLASLHTQQILKHSSKEPLHWQLQLSGFEIISHTAGWRHQQRPGCDVTLCVLMGIPGSTKEPVLWEFLRLSSLAMPVFVVLRSLGTQSAQQQ